MRLTQFSGDFEILLGTFRELEIRLEHNYNTTSWNRVDQYQDFRNNNLCTWPSIFIKTFNRSKQYFSVRSEKILFQDLRSVTCKYEKAFKSEGFFSSWIRESVKIVRKKIKSNKLKGKIV